MKRVLCVAVLGMVAFGGVATAVEPVTVEPSVSTENGVSVGVSVGFMGRDPDPVGGARYNATTGEACVGFSYQVPQCAGGPIS